ncbi:MAG: 6-bladed beta-propeller [Macellibacteroides fermentans]|uniref:6-bladed beta-propeller n=1 Tax=Macellibacteroides fermentans TaxID=879969 RepID=UPI003AD7B84C
MKKGIISWIIIVLSFAGCKHSSIQNDNFITVDVTANYPIKELILQDLMDVEYIPLETTDKSVCQGFVQAVGKDIVIVRNYNADGEIFIFDRKTGKSLKRINRKGQGNEEYTHIQRIVLDEDNNEIFVNDHFIKKILVYDLDGNFKRSLKQDDDLYFSHVYNFDQESLICNNYWVTDKPSFTIISKKDGHIIKEIVIPFKEKISLDLIVKDEVNNMTYGVTPQTYYPIIPNFDNWLLVEQSSDTVYRYFPDHTMKPLIVRTPSVKSMSPEIFLFMSIVTARYYFMEAVKKEFDFKTSEGFPSTDLMYDNKEKAIFNYVVYNNDYSENTPVNMNAIPVNEEIASWQSLDVNQLTEDYKRGILKGQLKEITSRLQEDSNPVIMLMKYRE